MKTNISTLGDYEFLDCGGLRRLERFGPLVLDRAAPFAHFDKSLPQKDWEMAHASFKRNREGKGHWLQHKPVPEFWTLSLLGLTVKLKLCAQNQVGLFLEQAKQWQWLAHYLKSSAEPIKILNGFAHTGLSTLIASAQGPQIEVCHVDSAKTSVEWAKENAKLSGLENNNIRWITEDLMLFLEREKKRNKTYDAFILDPPAFGRSAKGHFKLKRDFAKLLEQVKDLLSANPRFVMISCHDPEILKSDLIYYLESLKTFKGQKASAYPLTLTSRTGQSLPLGIGAVIARNS